MAIERRSKYSNRELINGSYRQEFYLSPINYETDAGTLYPISTELNNYIDDVYDLGVTQADIKVKYPNNEMSSVNIYKKNGDNIKNRFKGLVLCNKSTNETQSLGNLKLQPIQYVSENEVMYEDVYPGVDLIYAHGGHYIRQRVIISKSFRDSISIPIGWDLADVLICKVNHRIKTGEGIVVRDGLSYFEVTNYAVNEVMVDGDTVTEGASWDFFISEAGDFTLNDTFTDQGATSKDTRLASDTPTTNLGSATFIACTRTSTPVEVWSILEFDLSEDIDIGDTINSSELTVFKLNSGGTWTGRFLEIGRAINSWVESTATYSNYAVSNRAGTPTPVDSDSSTNSADAGETAYTFDSEVFVADWIAGTNTNNGFFLKFTTDSTTGDPNLNIYSAEGTTKPKLVVDFTPAVTGYTNKVSGVAVANIGKVNDVATASIGKVNGV